MITTTATTTELFLQAATDVGFQLLRDAIWNGNACNWVGASIAPANGRYQVVRNNCPDNVYSGLSGIALFLAALTEEVKDPLLDELCVGTVNTILQARPMPDNQNYGYYNGKLGIADTLISLGEMKLKPKWVKAGWTLLQQVCKKDPQEEEIDVIAGVAGAIPVLLRRYADVQEDWLLDAAIRCGDFLIAKAVKHPESITWISMPGSPGLTGYSHGNAGIALALLELYKATNAKKWLDHALLGFQYERQHFDATVQNWPDLRQRPGAADKPYTCAEAWCHGAPGIALSRLRAWYLSGDASFLNEAHVAINTTLQGLHRSQTNYSLCHGIAGNADVLLSAGMILNNQVLLQAAQEAGRMGIERIGRNNLNWPSGVSDPMGGTTTYENPSLLLGSAGTGYFFLRLANPSKHRSMLLVE